MKDYTKFLEAIRKTEESLQALEAECINLDNRELGHEAKCIREAFAQRRTAIELLIEAQAGRLFIISGPSGIGKTTLAQSILQLRKDTTRVITCTTRAPRTGEQDGVDYYFLSSQQFIDKMQAGELLEYANVYGNWYGTPLAGVMSKLKAGQNVFLTLDTQGAMTVQQKAESIPELKAALHTVFIAPASLQELENRLRKRHTESEDALKIRLEVAHLEIALRGNYRHQITSGSPEEDVRRMLEILGPSKA